MPSKLADKTGRLPVFQASQHPPAGRARTVTYGAQLAPLSSPLSIMQLQSAIGNQAVSRMLARQGRPQPDASRQSTAAAPALIQREIAFEELGDLSEVQALIEQAKKMILATPITAKEKVEGKDSPWNLRIAFGRFGKEDHGSTKRLKSTNVIYTKLNLESLADKDQQGSLGRILETFLHEWELHGANYTNEEAYNGPHKGLLEHFNLVDSRNKIALILEGLKEQSVISGQVYDYAIAELEKDKKVHANDLGLIGIVPIVMSESKFDQIHTILFKNECVIDDNLDGIEALEPTWEELKKKDIVSLLNNYYKLLFNTAVADTIDQWDTINASLIAQLRDATGSYSSFLKKVRAHLRSLREQGQPDAKQKAEKPQQDYELEEELREPDVKRVNRAGRSLKKQIECYKLLSEQCEKREQSFLEVAKQFA